MLEKWRRARTTALAEFRYFVRPVVRSFLKIGVGVLLICLISLLCWVYLGDARSDWMAMESYQAESMDWLGFWAGWAFVSLSAAIFVGAAAASIRLLWLMFGRWSLLPLILLPLAAAFSVYVLSDLVLASCDVFLEAVKSRASELNYMVPGDIGTAARTPLGAIFFVIHLVGGTLMYLSDPSILGAMVLVPLTLAFAIFVGVVPAFVISFFALARAYIRRFQERQRSVA